jgi:hypothetical protein
MKTSHKSGELKKNKKKGGVHKSGTYEHHRKIERCASLWKVIFVGLSDQQTVWQSVEQTNGSIQIYVN